MKKTHSKKNAVKLPSQAVNQTELAKIISAAFNCRCSRRLIHRAIVSQTAPQPDSAGRYGVAQWLTWWRGNKSAVEHEAAQSADVASLKKRRELLQIANAEFAAEKNKGLWENRLDSVRRFTAEAQEFFRIVRTNIEFEPEKIVHARLKELGCGDLVISKCREVVREAGVKVIDALEIKLGILTAEEAKLNEEKRQANLADERLHNFRVKNHRNPTAEENIREHLNFTP
ncbi:MAG: hypothetical protein WAO02_14805 [Verrucomicrobiia bacterium]